MGLGRKNLEPHPIRFQKIYSDHSRKLNRIKLTYAQAEAAYTCRRCRVWMGCSRCIDDVASLVCLNCHDWANDISERVHGRMVKDPELQQEGMRLSRIYSNKAITWEEYLKLWNAALDQVHGKVEKRFDDLKIS